MSVRPLVLLEERVDYQNTVFVVSDSSVDISLIILHDNSPCGIWPLTLDAKQDEPKIYK